MEIKKLLEKGVIVPTVHEPGEYISPIFSRAKRDGSSRLILNLKSLNKYVEYHHFKMDSCYGSTHGKTKLFYGLS